VESSKIDLKDPTRAGYTFGGWYDNSGFNGNKITAILSGSTGHKTLYAKWTVIEYTISYVLNSGTNASNPTTKYTIESANITLPTPTRAGYTFGGWYDNASFNNTAIATIPKGSTGNKTYYAQWTVIEYTISYTLNGGVNSPDSLARYTVEDTVVLQAPSKIGYDFAGWYADANFEGGKVDTIAHGSTGHRTLYAKWDTVYYAITYALNGGINSPDSVARYTVEDTVALQAPSRSGYDFKGWYANAGFAGGRVDTIARGSTGDTTLYAKWATVYYAITYALNGGVNSPDSVTRYTVEDTTITLRSPNKAGYTFAGWYADAGFAGGRVDTIAHGSTGDMTLYAKWDTVYYAITYALNGGINSPDSVACYTVEDAVALQAPSKADYTFAGWYADASFAGGRVDTIARGSTGDTTLYAKWDAVRYRITYVLNGGINSPDSVTRYTVEDTTITLRAPGRIGYDVAGS
jgi:uncharacterized repeat protein (TIGR02543 family)